MATYQPDTTDIITQGEPLEVLSPEQICHIDELLASVGSYGELHLIVEEGEVRYFELVESHKAWGAELVSV